MGSRLILAFAVLLAARAGAGSPPPFTDTVTGETLAVTGTAADVPGLAALLADPGRADAARRALEGIPGREATAALVAAAASSTGPVLAGIANSLGERRDPAAVPVLVRLAGGSDTLVAACAAGSLGRICDVSAAEALTSLRRKAAREVRSAVTDACLECADALRGRDPRRAGKIYAALWSRTGPGRVRAAALLGLAGTGGANSFPTILKALADPDAAVFGAALRAVRETPGPVPSESMKAAFRKLPPGDQGLVVEALSRRTDAAGRGIAAAAAGSRDEAVALAGLRALGRIGDTSSILLLAKASATLTGEARDAARASLDALPGPLIDAAMIALLKPSTAPRVRTELIRSLAARNALGAAPALEAGTRDADPGIQLEAAKALGILAPATGLAPLLALVLATPDDEVRGAAAKSAAAIVGGVRNPAAAAAPVLEALAGAAPAARIALLSILPAAGGAAALAAVEREAGNADPAVGKAAIRAMGDWPESNPRAYGFLAATADSHPDVTRRVLALRGAVRLAGLPSDRAVQDTVGMFAFLLSVARRPEDCRPVLAGLGRIADPGALALASSKLEDSAVRDEASSAVLAIAKAIKASYPEEAAAALDRAVRAGMQGKPAEEAAKLLADLRKLIEFVTAWEVAGPYRAAGVSDDALLDHGFPPEDAKAAVVEWKRVQSDAESESPWQVDLSSVIGGEHCAAYLRTWLWSPVKQKARFEIGSDDGVKVWLNGEVVHANNARRPVADGEDKADVKLLKGWNPVLLKVTQGDGGWGASLRVRTRDGKPVEGLKARTKPE